MVRRDGAGDDEDNGNSAVHVSPPLPHELSYTTGDLGGMTPQVV